MECRVTGWGDKLARLFKRLGFKQCHGCRRRANLLNRLQILVRKAMRGVEWLFRA